MKQISQHFIRNSSNLDLLQQVVKSYLSTSNKQPFGYSGSPLYTIPLHEAQERTKEIFSTFKAHQANHHELFDYLKHLTNTRGLTAEQYVKYRNNFILRTRNTIVSVGSHIGQAARNGDFSAMALISKNFADEAGHGDPQKVHLNLLEESHNIHGERVFCVPYLKIKDADQAQFIIPEVLQFAATQRELFASSYPKLTGCLSAHEGAADNMLTNFRETIFETYKGYYTAEEFNYVMRYFDEHRDDTKPGGDVEAEHERQAISIVAHMIAADPSREEEIEKGGLMFLDAQSNMWSGLQKTLEKSQNRGQLITPLPEFARPSNVFKAQSYNASMLEQSKQH